MKKILLFLFLGTASLCFAQSKPFSALATVTPVVGTELATATGGVWKKFQITALKPLLSAGVR